MSPDEHQFAIKYAELCRSQLKIQVLDKLPAGIRQLEEDTVLSQEPNLNNYVFLKVNQTQSKVRAKVDRLYCLIITKYKCIAKIP